MASAEDCPVCGWHVERITIHQDQPALAAADALLNVLALALAECCLVEATAAERLRRASYVVPAKFDQPIPGSSRNAWLAERREAADAHSLAAQEMVDAVKALRVARADAGLPII